MKCLYRGCLQRFTPSCSPAQTPPLLQELAEPSDPYGRSLHAGWLHRSDGSARRAKDLRARSASPSSSRTSQAPTPSSAPTSVAKAAPDGYTFGTVIAAHAANATLNPKLPYDTLKDFTYVSLMSVAPLIMIAHPSVPANNVKELIALAKAKPGELNFASSGIGAAAHLTMEMFMSRTGIKMQHIPYKGTAGALQDTVGGQINVMFDIVGPLMPQVRSGNAKAIVVTAKERIPAASDVPTMAEQGVPDFVSGTWAGIIAPAGTPKEIVDRVSPRRPRRHSPIRRLTGKARRTGYRGRWAAPWKNSAPSSPRRSRDGAR